MRHALARTVLPFLALSALALVPLLSRTGNAEADAEAPLIERVEVRYEAFDPAAEGMASDHRFDRRVTIHGARFYGTAFGPWVRFELPGGEVVESPLVLLLDEGTIEAALPEAARGTCRVVVENPDRRAASLVAGF